MIEETGGPAFPYKAERGKGFERTDTATASFHNIGQTFAR